MQGYNVINPSTGVPVFSVDETTGNVIIAGILTVAGAQTFTGNQTVTGNETVGGTLTVTGQTMFSNTVTSGGTLLVGGTSFLGDNGAGELQLTNTATPPTTAPTGGVDVYAQSGVLKYQNPQGLFLTPSALVQAQNATVTVASTASITALQSFTVPANDPVAGAVYEMTGYGVYSDTGTPTLTFTLVWGGAGGTALATVPAITLPLNIVNSPFSYTATLNFRSTTSVFAAITLNIDTSTTTDLASTYVATPTAPVTVTTTAGNALVLAVTWSASSSSNTISLFGGRVSRLA